jgi:hypothetical protein
MNECSTICGKNSNGNMPSTQSVSKSSFQGRFFVHPGDASARNSPFTRVKIDVCDPAGCLSELCIQLSIIMVGKQLLNNFLEILYP